MRTVTRHQVDEQVFYIKTYWHKIHPFASLKYRLKKSSSRVEWELAPQLQKLEIKIVPHIAHSEIWTARGLATILVTEGPASFSPATSVMNSFAQTALGGFLKTLHDRGVFHGDLTIANLLYSATCNQFCLVDLDNIRIHTSLSDEQRLSNLASLNRRLPLTDAFFEGYDNGSLRWRNRIARRAARKVRRSIPRKLKLLFSRGQAFLPKQIGGMRWRVRRLSWGDPLESILKDPDGFLNKRARLLKKGTRSTVGCADGFVVKRFNFKKVSTVIFDLFRASRGRRGFRTARHLELLGIPTPLPVAYADRRRFGLIVQSYFVMEEIPNAQYVWRQTGPRKEQIARLAELIGKTHAEGFSHRDLKETNIIADASGKPFLIDLDALSYVGKVSNPRAVLELVRLAQGFARQVSLSAKDRVRFLILYCRARDLDNWRWWWRETGSRIPPHLFK